MNTEVIIVLVTSGKGVDVDCVKVKLFEDEKEAETYCKENTDVDEYKKFWQYCEVIRDNTLYEVCRGENIIEP